MLHTLITETQKIKIDSMSDIGLFEHILGDVKLEKKPPQKNKSGFHRPAEICEPNSSLLFTRQRKGLKWLV